MTAPVLGIDLGTTNSVVAIADAQSVRVLATEDGQRLIPSVVAFPPDGEMVVGRAARERRLIDARNTIYSVKRLIGRPYRSPEVRTAQERFAFELIEGPTGGVAVRVRKGTFQVPEVSAFVLREVRRVAEAALGEPCTRAVVTVPANFNELQRSATKAAGSIAGLDVLRILNEPTAAALAYGYQVSGTQKVAVYDLGGGTFDFTVLETDAESLQVVATAGDTFLGGDDFDVLLAEELSDRFLRRHRWNPRDDLQAFERLRAAAEWAKCQLSTEKKITVRVRELAYGPGGQSLDLDEEIRRTDLEVKIRGLVGRSFDVVQDCLRLASLKPAEIDAVVLVGGSTRVPLVQMLVKEYFRKEPMVGVDPDLVVAQGAAIQGRALMGPIEQKAIGKIKLKRVAKSGEETQRKRSGRKSSKRPEQPAFGPDRPAPAPAHASKRPGVRLGDIVEVGPNLDEARPTGEMDLSGATLRDQPAPLKHLPPLDLSQTRDSFEPSVVVDSVYAELTASLAGKDVDALFASSEGGATSPDALPSPLDDEPTRVTAKMGAPFAPAASSPPPAAAIAPPAAPPPKRRRDSTRPFATTPIEPAVEPSRAHGEPATVAARGPLPAAPAPAPAPAAPPAPPSTKRRASGRAGRPAAAVPPPPPPPPPTAPARPLVAQAAPPASDFVFVAPTSMPETPLFPDTSTQPFMTHDAGSAVDPGDLRLPARDAPLLMDVTPHALGLETAGGFCRQIIRRGAPIPAESSRVFTTATDLQSAVVIRICQGEHELFADNQALGEIVLDGLPLAPRGGVQIDVAFQLGADGTLDVRARDVHAQREQRIRIQLLGGMSPEEIAALRARQEKLARR
ncbi:MAG: Hsp70 family protein [Deltaproteobacteria bacterium]|nr:Hsp70 family protein [Deltaproteobacteria bacterium]